MPKPTPITTPFTSVKLPKDKILMNILPLMLVNRVVNATERIPSSHWGIVDQFFSFGGLEERWLKDKGFDAIFCLLSLAIFLQLLNLPDNVGYPVGENGVHEYYMLELHYDNPEMLEGLQFETGAVIYYTDQLR